MFSILLLTAFVNADPVARIPYKDVNKYYLTWNEIKVDGKKLSYEVSVVGSNGHYSKRVFYDSKVPVRLLIAHKRSIPTISGLPSPGTYRVTIRGFNKNVNGKTSVFTFTVNKPIIKNAPAPVIRLELASPDDQTESCVLLFL